MCLLYDEGEYLTTQIRDVLVLITRNESNLKCFHL